MPPSERIDPLDSTFARACADRPCNGRSLAFSPKASACDRQLRAGFHVIGVIALHLDIDFTHILAGVGFAIMFGTSAMVGLRYRVNPHLVIATTRCFVLWHLVH